MKKYSDKLKELVSQAKSNIEELSIEAFNERMNADDKYCLLDVREDCEWERGHIFGALHIGRGVLECDVERWVPDKQTEIIVYCRSGGRSALAAQTLQQMGYANVKSLKGGISEWVALGLEIDGELLEAKEQETLQAEENEQAEGYITS